MKRKGQFWNKEKVVDDKSECTDFIIIDGEVYRESEVPFELVDDLPEVIDEDLLYEVYRDEKLERLKPGGKK